MSQLIGGSYIKASLDQSPKTETEIEAINREIVDALTGAERVVASLLTRIHPVLRQDVPGQEAKASVSVLATCPQTELGGRLAGFRDRLKELSSNVDEVLSRLEV